MLNFTFNNFLNWRMIPLQCCVCFCRATWISHKYKILKSSLACEFTFMFAINIWLMGFQAVIANASLVAMFLPILQGPLQTPTCLSMVLSHLLHLILLHHRIQSPWTLLRSHHMLFSVGLSKDCPSLPSTGSNFLSTEASFLIFQATAGIASTGSRASAQIPLRSLCYGFMLCSLSVFTNNVSCVVVNKVQSCGEGCVLGHGDLFYISSSLWFSSACPTPVLIPAQWPSPFPPIPTKGPGCKCWRGRLRLGAFEDLHTGNHHAQRTVTQRGNGNHHDSSEILMRKKDKSLLTAF